MQYAIISFKRPTIPAPSQTSYTSTFQWAASIFGWGTQNQPHQTPTLADTLFKELNTYFRLRDDHGTYSLQLKFDDFKNIQIIHEKEAATAALKPHDQTHCHIMFELNVDSIAINAFYKDKANDQLKKIPAFRPSYQARDLHRSAIEEAQRKDISLVLNPDQELFRLWAMQLPTTNTWPTCQGDLKEQGILETKYNPVGELAKAERDAERAAQWNLQSSF